MGEHRPVGIHKLSADDLATMDAVLTSFGEAFNEVETYGRARPSEEYLRRLLGSDHFIALYSKLGEREDVLHFDIAVTQPNSRHQPFKGWNWTYSRHR